MCGEVLQDKLTLEPCAEGEHEGANRLQTDDKKQEATSPLEFKVTSCLGAPWSFRAIEEGGGGDCFF
eukprot:8440769-Karenia_brevis.AAC.1